MNTRLALLVLAGLVQGCTGYDSKREVLVNEEDGVVVRMVEGRPTAQANSPDEIAKTGIVRVIVGRAIVPERRFEIARYRNDHTRYFAGPSFVARLCLLPVYIAFLVPLDLLLSGTHAGPFPFARTLFELDHEWEALPGVVERADVLVTDWCDRGNSEPREGWACELIVREGPPRRYVSEDPPRLRTIRGESGAGGVCEFDLRPLARDSWDRHQDWNMELEVTPGGETGMPPIVLSKYDVYGLAALK
ncbi:MAG: hypothetical protein K8T20_20275 [Planctomycetes bacterium]|nr:hypothetical protein [Planctomycetota bacterium]